MNNPSIENIVLTGANDFIISQINIQINTHGHSLMTQVTGMGCALNGCLAAALSLSSDTSKALFSTLQFYTQAAEKASHYANGSGSFVAHFLDELGR